MRPSLHVRAVASQLGLDLNTVSVWSFGDSDAMARDLAALVVSGQKTATCGLEWSYEHDEVPIPKIGDVSIVTSFDGAEVLVVIETIEVTLGPMSVCTEDFARDEGEGDLSLSWWREAHRRFFARECARIGRTPTEEMVLVYERLRVLHVPAAAC